MRPRPVTASRSLGRLLPMALALLLCLGAAPTPALAGFVINVQSLTAPAGSTNDTLQVTLKNSGTSAVTIGGFAFEIIAGTGVSFTAVDISTTPAYIFAGHSAFGPDISNQPLNMPLPGNTLYAEDNYNGASGISLAGGATVGLGDVHFNVSPSATGPISIMLVGFPSTNLSDAAGNDITSSNGGTTFNGGTLTLMPSSVPEPSSLAMTALAITLGLGCRLIRRRRPIS